MSDSAYRRGNRHRKEGNFEEAHRAYTEALREDETNTHAWCNLALLYAMWNRNVEAEKYFRAALLIDKLN